jgi:hypothetical protein
MVKNAIKMGNNSTSKYFIIIQIFFSKVELLPIVIIYFFKHFSI